jgi:hypothetical protein
MTVNQTIRQTRKVIAYFRRSVVQKWGQGQAMIAIIRKVERIGDIRAEITTMNIQTAI